MRTRKFSEGMTENTHRFGEDDSEHAPVQGRRVRGQHHEDVTILFTGSSRTQIDCALVTGLRRSVSLKLSDTRVYEPQTRTLNPTPPRACTPSNPTLGHEPGTLNPEP